MHGGTSIVELERRKQEIESYLSGKLKRILDVRKKRTEAMREFQDRLQDVDRRIAGFTAEARERCTKHRERVADLQCEIAALQEELQDEIALLNAAGEYLDTITAELHDERRELLKTHAPLRVYWRDQLAACQDGKTRRKRSELAKVLRRLEAKQERAKQRASRKPLTATEITFGELPEKPDQGAKDESERKESDKNPSASGEGDPGVLSAPVGSG